MMWGGIRTARMALALGLLAGMAVALPAATQETQNSQQPGTGGTVGPDSLRDFSLGGTQRPTPAPSQPAPILPSPALNQAPASSSTADRLAPPIRLPSGGQQGGAPTAAQGQPTSPAASPRPASRPPAAAPSTGQQIAAPPPQIAQPQLQDDGFIPQSQQAPARPGNFGPLPGEEKQDWPWWTWGSAALALLMIGAVALRRRRNALAGGWQDDSVSDAPAATRDVAPASSPEAAEIAPQLPVARKLAAEIKPDLRFMLSPMKATLTADHFTIDYELRISNRGAAAVSGLAVNVAMIMAGPEQDKAIEALVDHPPESRGNRVAELRAQNAVTMKGSARVPISVLRVVNMENRQLLLPVLVFTARAAASDGSDVLVKAGHAAWLIGRKGGADGRMAPLRTDQGARVWRDLDCRKQ